MMNEIAEDLQTRQTLRAGTIVQFNGYPVQLEIETPVYTSEGTWRLIQSEMAVMAAAINQIPDWEKPQSEAASPEREP